VSGAWWGRDLDSLAAATGIRILSDEVNRQAASEDFGHLIQGSSAGVVRPATEEEVEAIIRFAARGGFPVTPRGAGHSTGGQSVALGSLTLDLSRMSRILEVSSGERIARCEPGTTFRQLVAATMEHGMLPKVLPLNLDLTVGGTLSVGGFGTGSHRFGPLVSNVRDLTVVTGGGMRVPCGREDKPEVFDAVLGGLGRCGVITSAALELRPATKRIRTFTLLYDDVENWLDDQFALSRSERCQALEGVCAAAIPGLRNTPMGRRPFAQWFFAIHAGFEFDPDVGPPDQATALARLRPYRFLHAEDDATLDFQARYDARFEAMRRTGADRLAHPFLTAFLPFGVMAELLPRLLQAIPLSIGDGHRLFILAPSQLPRFFMLPKDEPVVAFAVLPTGVHQALTDDVLAALHGIHDVIVEAGGKRYVADWLGSVDPAGWRAHFGERFDEWAALKDWFDPQGVFASVLEQRLSPP
jgi:cytokinin dehydrogenase